MQWTAGRGFLRRGLQICEALRRLCRHHVVASVEWPCKRLPAEILDRSDRWLALPVLKEKLGQYNASQLRAGPGRLLLIKANHRCRPDLGAASQTASRDLPYAGD